MSYYTRSADRAACHSRQHNTSLILAFVAFILLIRYLLVTEKTYTKDISSDTFTYCILGVQIQAERLFDIFHKQCCWQKYDPAAVAT